MIDIDIFGEWQGQTVERYRLENVQGMRADILNWGGVLAALQSPPKDEIRRNLVLGFQSFADYPEKSPYFGATIGRVANRIAGARFAIDGEEFPLIANEGGNQLHGGPSNLGRRVWQARTEENDTGPSVILDINSPDGDQGYPGDFQARCTYTLGHDNSLSIEMSANCTRSCPVNLVHHSYWNLDGGGVVDRHLLRLFAQDYLPTDAEQIPNGLRAPVADGPLDFRDLKRLDHAGPPTIDYAFILESTKSPPQLHPAATLLSSDRLCRMHIETDQPSVQCYTSFKMDIEGSRGEKFPPRSGICLETQAFPNAPNTPNFPSTILNPNQTYRHHMRHAFEFDWLKRFE